MASSEGTEGTEGTRVIEASGWVSQSGQVELSLPWHSYITTEPVVTDNGDYSIQAVDAGGSVLASQGFTLSFYVRSNPPRTVDRAPFVHVMVPFPDGTKKFQVVDRNGSVLEEISVSSEVPSITVYTPTAGREVAGIETITWTADDPDGDSLQYKVEYSPDGLNWDMLAFRLTGNEWVQDFNDLPGGERAQIRVTASDGINNATAVSGEFRVPVKGPDVFIEAPEPNSNHATADGLVLNGAAYDPQEGQIYDDNRLIWTSDRAGELGRGPTVFASNLAEGSHVITLTATNSTGISNSHDITVNIAASPVIEPDSATELQAKTDIDPLKQWRVIFNQPVDFHTLPGQVLVLDSGKNPVTVEAVPGEDEKSVIVYPPSGGYLPGQTYTIYVISGIKSTSGQPLKCKYKMNFTIMGG